MAKWTLGSCLTGGLLVLAAGCAHFESRPIDPGQTAARFDARTLDAPGLKQFIETNGNLALPEWPLATWDFDALTLAALYYHPSLEIARAQWRVAQAGEITAGQRPNPTVGAAPGYTFNAADAPTPWLAFVDLDVPIETAGKRGYRRAQAQHQTRAARLRVAAAAWQVRSGLRTALSAWRTAEERAALLRRQLAVQDETGRRLQQKLAAGAIPRNAVTTLRVAQQKTRLELAAAERARADAHARIAEAVGVPERALAKVKLAFDLAASATNHVARLTAAETRRLALRRRSDILAALADYAASQAALQLEIARQYPDVHLGPGYEFDTGESKWSLGLSAELPVLHQNQGAIAEARARRAEAAARFEALQAQVIGEIDRALAVYQTARAQLVQVDGLLAAQQQQVENAQARFAAGAAERLDVLDTQLESAAGELTRLDTLQQLQQAAGQLEDALQVPLEFMNHAVFSRAPLQGTMHVPNP